MKEPTDAQKKAGNYPKGHKFLHGMRISIENEAGSDRRGVDKDGVPWVQTMAHDYGYVRGTKGYDKDHLDVFMGPHADKPDRKVYIVDQDNDEGKFDEHKIMMGFDNANDAYHAYHANYPDGWGGFSDITEMDMPEFKDWAFSGTVGGKRKRVSDLARYKDGGAVVGNATQVRAGEHGAGVGAGATAKAQGAVLAKPKRETLRLPKQPKALPNVPKPVVSLAAGGLVDMGKLENHFVDVSKGQTPEHCECGNNTKFFAQGGMVGGTPAVGLATFDYGNNAQAAPATQMQPVNSAAPGGAGGSGGNLLGQFNPGLAAGSGAPSYNFNDPTSTALFGMGMTAMGHAGRAAQGNQAFLGDDFGFQTPLPNGTGDSSGDTGVADANAQNAKSTQALMDLGKSLGVDTSGYNQGIGLPTAGKALLDFTKQIQAINSGDTSYKPYDGLRANVGYAGGDGMNKLYADLQNQTKDYMRVRSASAGWDGKNDPRSMADVMYHQTAPGQWVPVSKPKYYKQPKKGSWAQEDGADLIAAASMIMPAFGGWAGALGNGAAGTLTAGGGLGLTGSLPSAVVNAGMGAALGGGTGALAGGLGGWAGGLGGQALGNALGGYGALGQIVGTQLGRQAGSALATKTR